VAKTYDAIYRARAVKYESSVVTAYVPQVFGETAIQIVNFLGTPATGMGWVLFQGGNPEFPVWTSGLGGGDGGGGGGGTVTDTLWVGTDAPTDSSLELWYDTDEVAQYATATDYWNSSWGIVQMGTMKANGTLSATVAAITDPLVITTVAGRRYRLKFQMRAGAPAAAGTSAINFLVYVDGAVRLDLGDWYVALPTQPAQYGSTDWGAVLDAGDGASHSYAVYAKAVTVNAQFYVDNCKFYIEDIGPVTRLPSNTPPPTAFDWAPYDARYVDSAELVAALAPSAWTTLTMNAPWTGTNPYGHDVPQWRKVGDNIELRGTTTTPGTISNSTLTTLPVGARPAKPHIFAVWMSWNGASARHAVRLWVGNDGAIIFDPTYSLPTPAVTVTNVDHLSLDGMFFSVTT